MVLVGVFFFFTISPGWWFTPPARTNGEFCHKRKKHFLKFLLWRWSVVDNSSSVCECVEPRI